MILHPDMSRDQYIGSEAFMFASPCTKDEWYTFYTSEHCVKEDGKQGYILLDNAWGLDDPAAMILCVPEATDDDAVETAAWIRIKYEFSGPIYAMKYAPETSKSFGGMVARTAGVNPKQIRYINFPND